MHSVKICATVCSMDLTVQARPVGSGGLASPNNLLKFVDFVSEKGCKSQGRKNEDSNSYMFEEATNAISFDVIQFKNFKIFMEKPSLVMILCFRQWHVFQKWGVQFYQTHQQIGQSLETSIFFSKQDNVGSQSPSSSFNKAPWDIYSTVTEHLFISS